LPVEENYGGRSQIDQKLKRSLCVIRNGQSIQRQKAFVTPAAAIIDCNPSAEKILGLSRDQILGRTSMNPHWQSVREDGRVFSGEEHPAMVSL